MDVLVSIWNSIKKTLFIIIRFLSGKLASWVDRHERKNQPETIKELTFADKKVADVMVAYKDVKWVEAGEPISPTVMDELHKSGQTRFPVVKTISKSLKPDVKGVLYIERMLDQLDKEGKISDLMIEGANYISQDESLEQALASFVNTGSQLLLVTNQRQEVVGDISLEQVLFEAIGFKA